MFLFFREVTQHEIFFFETVHEFSLLGPEDEKKNHDVSKRRLVYQSSGRTQPSILYYTEKTFRFVQCVHGGCIVTKI